MSKTTMYRYLAERVPADVHFVLNKYSRYDKARNPDELEYQIKDFVNNYGDNGLKAIAEIHPDRDLIELSCVSCKSKDDAISQLQNQNTLVDSLASQSYFNAIGNTQSDSISEERVVNKMAVNTAVIGGFVLMGIALMLKK
jgi:hypothetical protein